MRRKIDLSIGEYYHIYNRGTDKRVIFEDEHDRKRFVALLYTCNGGIPVDISRHFRDGKSFRQLFELDRGDQLVDIIVYCLMPNHFHLLLREKIEGGIQKFMLKVSTGYSMYFNSKNERSGALFEGRFKAKHADTDGYLKYLFAYIHLNPVKLIDKDWKENGIKDRISAQNYLNSYTHLSYLDWQGASRLESQIINKEVSPEYFMTAKEFSDFVEDWLTFKEEEEQKRGEKEKLNQ